MFLLLGVSGRNEIPINETRPTKNESNPPYESFYKRYLVR